MLCSFPHVGAYQGLDKAVGSPRTLTMPAPLMSRFNFFQLRPDYPTARKVQGIERPGFRLFSASPVFSCCLNLFFPSKVLFYVFVFARYFHLALVYLLPLGFCNSFDPVHFFGFHIFDKSVFTRVLICISFLRSPSTFFLVESQLGFCKNPHSHFLHS